VIKIKRLQREIELHFTPVFFITSFEVVIGFICRCECFGHAKLATYIKSNATHHGKCVCDCDALTFTEGEKVSSFVISSSRVPGAGS